MRRLVYPSLALLALLVLGGAAGAAQAGGFAAVVSPPRFELTSKGGTLRQVFELTNRANTPAKYHVRTADFTLGADYGVAFHDELMPGSCRPWVALERPEMTLPGGGTMRYRFEVQVPKDAPAGECRFGILIEGDEPAVSQGPGLQIPVAGRIGIIVYVVVGDAAPKIEVFGPEVVSLNGRQVPALRVHNEGNAHTRMSGFLTGADANGKKYDFTPSDLPVLPGETRLVFLTPSTSTEDYPTLTFPVSVQGTLEWSDQTLQLNERFK